MKRFMLCSWTDINAVTTIAQVSTFACMHALECLHLSSTAVSWCGGLCRAKCSGSLASLHQFYVPAAEKKLLLDDTPYLLLTATLLIGHATLYEFSSKQRIFNWTRSEHLRAQPGLLDGVSSVECIIHSRLVIPTSTLSFPSCAQVFTLQFLGSTLLIRC